jgi:MerR family mercuric resistance operon transcriptional regulator
VNIETIRYYERIGLLMLPRRTLGKHRVYDDGMIAQLQFIRRSRELGFSLEDIRALIGLADNRGRSCAEVKTITQQHAVAIRRKIGDLERIERALLQMVALCRGRSAPDCPILETLSSAIPKE